MTAAIDERIHRARTGNRDAWLAVARALGGDVIDADGLLTYFSGAYTANFNPTLVTGPVADPAGLLAERAALYAGRGIPFGFETPAGYDEGLEAAALARGLTVHAELPTMVLHPIPDLPPAAPFIRPVAADDLDRFLQTQAAGFGNDIDNLRAFARPSMLDACDLFIAEADDGVVAATALSCVTGRDGGIFGVATRPEYRRRGFGRAATEAAVRAAVDRGADLIFLHASDIGRPVYEQMGFRAVEITRIYTVPDGDAHPD